MRFKAFRYQTQKQINAYSIWVEQLIKAGWTGNIVTFMFADIPGGARRVDAAMREVIERVYSKLLRYMYHDVRAKGVVRPMMFTAKDWPVFKYEKISLMDAVVNDGLHQHGLLLMPPVWSRLKDLTVADHFSVKKNSYGMIDNLDRVHVQPFMDQNIDRIVDYTFKGLKQTWERENEMMILPRSSSER